MDWKKSFQVEISPLASYAGEGLDKYKGTTLTAPCSINKVTLLVIFVSDVGCLTLLHIGGLTNIFRRICRMEPAKGFVLLSFTQKTFCNIAFLFLSQNAGVLCFLMISIKLTAQVPFCYHSIVWNSHVWFVIYFIFLSINDFWRLRFSKTAKEFVVFSHRRKKG